MSRFNPGEIIYTPAGPFGLVRHVGIVTEFGTIISNSKRRGRVAEETLEEFSDGQAIQSQGYPSNLSPREVLHRARVQIGKPWRLFGSNCEHFVRHAHGLEPRSPQLGQATAALLIGAVLGLAVARARA